MSSTDCSNIDRQAEELEVLQSIFGGEGEFELLSGPPHGGAPTAPPAEFRVRGVDGLPQGCAVLISLPPDYPASSPPSFAVEGAGADRAAALVQHLSEEAQGRLGEGCVFEVLQTLAERPGPWQEADGNGEEEGDVPAPPAADTTAGGDQPPSWAWACASGADTLVKVSVHSGTKVRSTQITNLSELRRLASAGCVCVDLQPSRNTENYELAAYMASCLRVSAKEVDLVAGGKKEKASGERQVRIIGMGPGDVVSRLLGAA